MGYKIIGENNNIYGQEYEIFNKLILANELLCEIINKNNNNKSLNHQIINKTNNIDNLNYEIIGKITMIWVIIHKKNNVNDL